MRRPASQRNPKRQAAGDMRRPSLKLAFAGGNERFLAAKRAFRAQNPCQNHRKSGSWVSFSFHEMSDFNALQRAFIKARTASGNGG
jgi:hypothetical protein